MIQVHLTPGDGKGWALDEDLRQIRESLGDKINECGPFGAEVIHAPFWQHLSMVSPRLLKGAFVIAHADNPPFFPMRVRGFTPILTGGASATGAGPPRRGGWLANKLPV